ncbi:hypothetical protein [uncultured Shimia sp.]|uniref:hypothetical protein n=1 Tax=uncultured Shimia sp. TaxID=573152 RepID=UPI0025E1B303|nr:hypothetical protein [uncultured Shimia sp.]
MTKSYVKRYQEGEHEQVWRELDFFLLPIKEQFEHGQGAHPGVEESHEIITLTFERVARNVDRLASRLRDIGYQFACEAEAKSPRPPRRPALAAAKLARTNTLERFDDLEVTGSGPFPIALSLFAELVGSVDLRQHVTDDQLDEPLDPILKTLGDWDPLEVNFDFLQYEIGEEEAELLPLPEGGLALQPAFAGSFEHKANISGAWNPNLRLPSYRVDPMVFAEGIALPFTTYLRKTFARGGFFGTPRPFFRARSFGDKSGYYLSENKWPKLNEVEPGIFLPEHKSFAKLAQDLEAF